MVCETRCCPMLMVVISIVLGFMLFETWITHHEDQDVPWSINSLRKAKDELHIKEDCHLGHRRLPLGHHVAWGFEHDRDGTPLSCSFCNCDVSSMDESPSPKCFIESCSDGQRWCPSAATLHQPAGDIRGEEPPHPCCSVCRPLKPPPNRTAEPEILAMDPVVPFTHTIYNSSFRHLPANLCGDSPTVLLAVTSIPAASARRATLRRLYQTDAAAHRVQLVFLLGRPGAVRRAFNDFTEDEFEFDSPEAEVRARRETEARAREAEARAPVDQRAVDAEAAAFGDIIQSDVPEHYFHLGLKTVSLLDAVQRRCPRLRFVAKTDDDVFVTVRRLAEEAAALNASRVIYGRLQERPSASRSLDSWYSSEREWPWPTYPQFVLGPGYLISGDAVGALFRQALRTRYHHLEDVYVTGVVAAAAGVARRHWRGMCFNHLGSVNVCQAAGCAFTHRVDVDRQRVGLEQLVHASRVFDVGRLCAPRSDRV